MNNSKNLKAAMLLLLAVGAIAARLSPEFMQWVSAITGRQVNEANSQSVKLVAGSVYDGDTFRVTDGRKEIKVRLCGIDAPELKQEGGRESRDRLRQLIGRGNGQIMVTPVDTDRYGRTVAEAFVPLTYSVGKQKEQEIHLNSQMVIEGMAYVYPQYVGSCPNAAVLQTAEKEARKNAVGVWHSTTSQKPWDYRHSKR